VSSNEKEGETRLTFLTSVGSPAFSFRSEGRKRRETGSLVWGEREEKCEMGGRGRTSPQQLLGTELGELEVSSELKRTKEKRVSISCKERGWRRGDKKLVIASSKLA